MLEEQQKEPQEKVEEQDGERVIKSIPRMLFDGNCDHYYQDDYLDNDGHQHAQCQYCPMGRLYEPDKAHLIDGKLVSLKE